MSGLKRGTISTLTNCSVGRHVTKLNSIEKGVFEGGTAGTLFIINEFEAAHAVVFFLSIRLFIIENQIILYPKT